MPGNPGAVAVQLTTGDALRTKSRDLVRRNPWANNAIEVFVANAIGTGIKPQSLAQDEGFRSTVQTLFRDWVEEADATGQTDFYGLQALACRAMVEAGECLIRLRPRLPQDGLSVPLQLQLLESEHLPLHLNLDLPNGNLIRAGIEFDRLGRRVAYHLYRSHPEDGGFATQTAGDTTPVRVAATEIIHLYRALRPGQIRGEPWLSRALVKLNELDQYDDAELVRKKTAAMFAGFITRQSPEDNLVGEGLANAQGIALAGMEPGTLQILEPGEDVKFSDPADVGGNYAEFLKTQFRAIAAAMGITYPECCINSLEFRGHICGAIF
jgi:lambda family phage portal protein